MKNTLLELADDKKSEIVAEAVRNFQASKKVYADKHLVWQECYKIYRAIAEDKDEEDEPNSFLPIAYGFVEDVVARLAAIQISKLVVFPKPKRKQSEGQAVNFYNIARTHTSSAKYILDYTNACRERVITGNQWEGDEWHNEYETGIRRVRSMVQKIIDSEIPLLSNAVQKISSAVGVSEWQDKPHDYPVRVGYGTYFPSVFRIFPQPGITDIDILRHSGWIVEENPNIAISELRKAQYKDPETGEMKQVYDLTAFDNDTKQVQKGRIKPQSPDGDFLSGFKTLYTGVNATGNDATGADEVHMLIIHKPRERWVVIQGKYLIQHITDPYNKPGIKLRLRTYTQDPQCLYGMGMIEPNRDLFYEFNDTHNLSFANFVRMIHQMIAFDTAAFPFPDDFNRRAGGQVRMTPGTVISRALAPIPANNVVNEMIGMESSIKGLLEKSISIADLSPGVQGTKAYQDTYGGLMEIQSAFAKRFSIMHRLDMAWTAQMLDEMYWMYDQFMFDSMPFNDYSDRHQGYAVEYTRDDIDTDGLGFFFYSSDDPSFGDSAVQRNQGMVLMRLFMEYETFRRSANDPTIPKLNLGQGMKDNLEAFGKNDVTKYLTDDNGVISPEEEYQLMIQGIPVQVNLKENHTDHFIKHVAQLQGIPAEAGQVKDMLIQHVTDTKAAIDAISENPEPLALEHRANGIISENRRQALPAPTMTANMGQNLPQNTGGMGEQGND